MIYLAVGAAFAGGAILLLLFALLVESLRHKPSMPTNEELDDATEKWKRMRQGSESHSGPEIMNIRPRQNGKSKDKPPIRIPLDVDWTWRR